MTKRETSSDFLKEDESQALKLRKKFCFSEHCKAKVKSRKQSDRFTLSTFEGSPTCSAKEWLKEMDTFLQLHQIPEEEAIIIVALRLRGKAYAWLNLSFFFAKM